MGNHGRCRLCGFPQSRKTLTVLISIAYQNIGEEIDHDGIGDIRWNRRICTSH